MLLDGKVLAEHILTDCAVQVSALKSEGITATLAVILVGDNPASLAYIRQKQKAAEKIGATIIFDHQADSITAETLAKRIKKYNEDPAVHGLIVQRPLPKVLGDVSKILDMISASKDVDGFLPDSPFDVPVAAAIGEILRNVYSFVIPASEPESTKITNGIPDQVRDDNFMDWLRKKHIVVIGRGETAGDPIYRYLKKLGCTTSQIHSKTPHPDKITKKADIIISCVGKERVVTKSAVKQDAILLSVGIWRDKSGKLRGDYDEEEIAGVASWYTPTPGGVGPVNVACLMQNLVKACKIKTGKGDVLP